MIKVEVRYLVDPVSKEPLSALTPGLPTSDREYETQAEADAFISGVEDVADFFSPPLSIQIWVNGEIYRMAHA